MTKTNTRQRDELVAAFSQHVLRLQIILDRSLSPVLAGYGLTRAEFDVLGALHRSRAPEGLRPKDLAARLLITTGGLSNVLRRLENSRLIARIPEPTDGRSHSLQLTVTGAALALEALTAGIAALSASLESAPHETLLRALDELQPILAAVDDKLPHFPDRLDRRTQPATAGRD
jgi:DNA-binding MarR family transcriptional regulator